MNRAEERALYRKRWRADHMEEEAAYGAKWKAEHKGAVAAYGVRYRERHPEKAAARHAAYCASHKEEILEKAARQQRWFTGNLRILRATQGCDDCGVHEGRLEHHHIDPDTKRDSVSRMSTYSLEAFMDEIAKCTVLCGSCHQSRHVEMQGDEAP